VVDILLKEYDRRRSEIIAHKQRYDRQEQIPPSGFQVSTNAASFYTPNNCLSQTFSRLLRAFN
jgi:hypothetical protein